MERDTVDIYNKWSVCQVLHEIGSDWPQKGEICDILKSVFPELLFWKDIASLDWKIAKFTLFVSGHI